ncbi:phage tail assembly protein [Lentisphaerota bacterium ZTH]|nr:phage tail assembly protein [Lentisphaerota bacterium]WET05833.1 phage tail assembly protein [Lentisphaerota bacterium ZTH]
MEKVKLEYAIEVNGQEVTELEVRRPTVKDQLAAERKGKNQYQGEKEVMMFADLCCLAPEDIYKMDMKDYLKLQEVFKHFLS